MNTFESLERISDKVGESKDCAVKALSIVCGESYSEIHYRFSKLGRKKGRATPNWMTWQVLNEFGFYRKRVEFKSKTIRTLGGEIDDKTYLVQTNRHILAIKDGKVEDWTKGRLNRVLSVWEIAEFESLPEQWLDVLGYNGSYQVSSYGRVRSTNRTVQEKSGKSRKLKGRLLRPGLSNGYPSVVLYKDFTKNTALVHKLVLESHIGRAPASKECCHNDGNRQNNKLTNLRWDTPRNNTLDKRKHGTHGGRAVKRGDGIIFDNLHIAGEKSGCDYRNIWAVCNGAKKTSGGYTWEYV